MHFSSQPSVLAFLPFPLMSKGSRNIIDNQQWQRTVSQDYRTTLRKMKEGPWKDHLSCLLEECLLKGHGGGAVVEMGKICHFRQTDWEEV